jgi:hypothetical protein
MPNAPDPRPRAGRLPTAALLACAACAAPAAAEIAWPLPLWDPAGAEGAPADLVLPMPCGGAMAFQRVAVAVGSEDPLADRRVRLGRASGELGVSDYLRFSYLRGPFGAGADTHYYIGRYEVTAGQFAALAGPCPDRPGRGDRLAQGGLSWYDALEFARSYTEWLRANAPDALPRVVEEIAFLRLPTEAEWEFAARGGEAVDPSAFAQPTFPMEGGVEAYARVSGGSVRGLGPIALVEPNPLGLYDVYGNAEELMLEPFRLNVAGRAHGQPGGVVTRGGSYLSSAGQVSSAARTEWGAYDRGGAPQAQESFGMRLVIAATASGDDQRLRRLAESFERRLSTVTREIADPLAELDGMIEEEVEADRRAALEGLRHSFVAAADRADEARREVARANLMGAVIFLSTIREEMLEIAEQQRFIEALEAFVEGDHDLSNPDEVAQLEYYSGELERTRGLLPLREAARDLSLRGYRSALALFADGDLPADALSGSFLTLSSQMAEQGLDALAPLLDAVLADIETFSARPDMDDAALIELVMR